MPAPAVRSTTDLITASHAARLAQATDEADALLLAAWLSYDEGQDCDESVGETLATTELRAVS